MNVRERIEMLRQFDPDAAEALALDTMEQYMMAKTTIDVIATRMGYSVGWVIKAREKVRKRWKEQASQLDIKQYTMGMLEQLQEIAAMGMREAALAGSSASAYGRRMAGIGAARNAIVDQAKLLHLAGAYETAPLRAAIQNDDETNSASGLKDMARNFLTLVAERKGVQPGDVIIDAGDDE